MKTLIPFPILSLSAFPLSQSRTAGRQEGREGDAGSRPHGAHAHACGSSDQAGPAPVCTGSRSGWAVPCARGLLAAASCARSCPSRAWRGQGQPRPSRPAGPGGGACHGSGGQAGGRSVGAWWRPDPGLLRAAAAGPEAPAQSASSQRDRSLRPGGGGGGLLARTRLRPDTSCVAERY